MPKIESYAGPKCPHCEHQHDAPASTTKESFTVGCENCDKDFLCSVELDPCFVSRGFGRLKKGEE